MCFVKSIGKMFGGGSISGESSGIKLITKDGKFLTSDSSITNGLRLDGSNITDVETGAGLESGATEGNVSGVDASAVGLPFTKYEQSAASDQVEITPKIVSGESLDQTVAMSPAVSGTKVKTETTKYEMSSASDQVEITPTIISGESVDKTGAMSPVVSGTKVKTETTKYDISSASDQIEITPKIVSGESLDKTVAMSPVVSGTKVKTETTKYEMSSASDQIEITPKIVSGESVDKTVAMSPVVSGTKVKTETTKYEMSSASDQIEITPKIVSGESLDKTVAMSPVVSGTKVKTETTKYEMSSASDQVEITPTIISESITDKTVTVPPVLSGTKDTTAPAKTEVKKPAATADSKTKSKGSVKPKMAQTNTATMLAGGVVGAAVALVSAVAGEEDTEARGVTPKEAPAVAGEKGVKPRGVLPKETPAVAGGKEMKPPDVTPKEAPAVAGEKGVKPRGVLPKETPAVAGRKEMKPPDVTPKEAPAVAGEKGVKPRGVLPKETPAVAGRKEMKPPDVPPKEAPAVAGEKETKPRDVQPKAAPAVAGGKGVKLQDVPPKGSPIALSPILSDAKVQMESAKYEKSSVSDQIEITPTLISESTSDKTVLMSAVPSDTEIKIASAKPELKKPPDAASSKPKSKQSAKPKMAEKNTATMLAGAEAGAAIALVSTVAGEKQTKSRGVPPTETPAVVGGKETKSRGVPPSDTPAVKPRGVHPKETPGLHVEQLIVTPCAEIIKTSLVPMGKVEKMPTTELRDTPCAEMIHAAVVVGKNEPHLSQMKMKITQSARSSSTARTEADEFALAMEENMRLSDDSTISRENIFQTPPSTHTRPITQSKATHDLEMVPSADSILRSAVEVPSAASTAHMIPNAGSSAHSAVEALQYDRPLPIVDETSIAAADTVSEQDYEESYYSLTAVQEAIECASIIAATAVPLVQFMLFTGDTSELGKHRRLDSGFMKTAFIPKITTERTGTPLTIHAKTASSTDKHRRRLTAHNFAASSATASPGSSVSRLSHEPDVAPDAADGVTVSPVPSHMETHDGPRTPPAEADSFDAIQTTDAQPPPEKEDEETTREDPDDAAIAPFDFTQPETVTEPAPPSAITQPVPTKDTEQAPPPAITQPVPTKDTETAPSRAITKPVPTRELAPKLLLPRYGSPHTLLPTADILGSGSELAVKPHLTSAHMNINLPDRMSRGERRWRDTVNLMGLSTKYIATAGKRLQHPQQRQVLRSYTHISVDTCRYVIASAASSVSAISVW